MSLFVTRALFGFQDFPALSKLYRYYYETADDKAHQHYKRLADESKVQHREDKVRLVFAKSHASTAWERMLAVSSGVHALQQAVG